MAFLSSVAEYLNAPGGLWEWLILKVFGFITNYGWRILLFVVLLKLVLFPLDLFQRIKMRKNQQITERIKPQMEKLQQQYAGDKQMLAQKQMELNKKEGFSYFSSCLPMIITLVIFFYLFAGLNNISQYMNLKQYAGLYDEYTRVERVFQEDFQTFVTDELPGRDDYNAEYDKYAQYTYEQFMNLNQDEMSDFDRAHYANLKTIVNNTMADRAKSAVVVYYEETSKESFLWIKNIWAADVPWTKSINELSTFNKNIGEYSQYTKAQKKMKFSADALTKQEYENMLSQYTNVTDYLAKSDSNGVNGFLILPILSVGLSFLSQFITSRLQKQAGQASPTGGMASSMKVMMIIMPLMMGFFALQYTSAFTLYIVVNSGMTILINVITTLAMNLKDGKRKKPNLHTIQKYGRPDPNDL